MPKSMFIKEHMADLRCGSGAWHGCSASCNPEICGQHSSGPRETLSFLPALCPPNERQLGIIPDRAGGFFLKEQDEGSFGRARGACSGWSSVYNQAQMPPVKSGVCCASHIQRREGMPRSGTHTLLTSICFLGDTGGSLERSYTL